MKNNLRVLLLIVLLVGTVSVTAQTRTATVAETLAYFQSLRDAGTNGFLVGQFGGYGSDQDVELATEHFEQAAAAIGDCPAITGWDLQNSDQTIEQSGDEAFAFWQRYPRLFYTLSAHIHNPFNGGKADNISGANRLRELLTTDSAAGRAYHDYLDRLAVQLQRFEDAGAVVLWRPLHEANGGWFWWGAGGDADYVALWRHMHDYFTRVKGLTNLIWVYAPNARFTRFDTMYPGGDVVDMVGLDYYKPLGTRIDLNSVGEYDFLAALGKPMYLAEFGARPASGAGWNTHAYDHALTMQAARDYPALIGALYWEYVWRIGYANSAIADYNQRVFLTDPLAATCGDIPAYGGGTPLPTRTAAPSATPAPSLPTRTATLPAPGTIIGAGGGLTVFEAAPRVGDRITIRVETAVAGVRFVELYQGDTWLARDRAAPYTFTLTIDPTLPLRIRTNWDNNQFLADYSLTYYMSAPTATPAAESFDLIVCIAEASTGATLTADSVVFDRDDCKVRP